jgi:hypothetical protein
MGKVCKYYADWQHEPFNCTHCEWTGTVGFEDLEVGDVAAIIECPKCYKSMGVLLYPNLQDTKEAAAQGNEKAIQALPDFEARINHNWELLKRFERDKIQSLDHFPNLEGESLAFGWDFVKGEDGEFYQIIKIGEVELWRELAFFNNLRRFEEVKELLKAGYGVRFKTLTPTGASIEWLSGDNFQKAVQISYR